MKSFTSISSLHTFFNIAYLVHITLEKRAPLNTHTHKHTKESEASKQQIVKSKQLCEGAVLMMSEWDDGEKLLIHKTNNIIVMKWYSIFSSFD
jgi:hypothetical protein